MPLSDIFRRGSRKDQTKKRSPSRKDVAKSSGEEIPSNEQNVVSEVESKDDAKSATESLPSELVSTPVNSSAQRTNTSQTNEGNVTGNNSSHTENTKIEIADKTENSLPEVEGGVNLLSGQTEKSLEDQHNDTEGTTLERNLDANAVEVSEEGKDEISSNEKPAVDKELVDSADTSSVTKADDSPNNTCRNDGDGVPETIRKLNDFIDETLETEIKNAALGLEISSEVSGIIEKLCSFVDITLEKEMRNVALGKRSESLETEQVPAVELTEVPDESPEINGSGNAVKFDTENIYEELSDNYGEKLAVEDEQSDTKSENLLLDEDAVLDVLPDVQKTVDILTPPEKDSSEDVEASKTLPSIEKLDTISTTGSMYSEQDDQGIYLPMPEFPNQANSKNPNWKVGYLQVKLPHKSRGRGKLKVWQKKLVVVQPDEFFEDQKDRSLILSIYQSDSTSSRRHNAAFWKSVCSKNAVVYRSVSRTHPYTFTVADDQGPIVHLATDSETETQEWMTAIRNVLWPPSSVMQLEKVLNGNEFEVSVIENDFTYRAGLLGTYGYLAVTGRKLILCHPQSGHVIQEWYLNTVDKFQLLPMPKEVDANKVLVMHTSSESSTGCGEIKFFCNEAVTFLQSLASTIHQVLQHHSKEKKGGYEKELEEISYWLAPALPPPKSRRLADEEEDHYKVPPRQVRSLLDIPNFIFDKSLGSTGLGYSPPTETPLSKLKTSTTSVSTFSQDSGISTAPSSDDFLNCSQTSFTIGNRSLRLRDRTSSGSDLSESYTPPITPDLKRKTVVATELPQQSVPQ